MRPGTFARLALVVGVSCLVVAAGSPGVQVSIAHVHAAGFSADGVSWRLLPTGDGWAGEAGIKTLRLPLVGTLRDVAAHCGRISITAQRFKCTGLTLHTRDWPADHRLPAALTYDRSSGELALALRAKRHGMLKVTAKPVNTGWRVRLRSHAMPLTQLPVSWLPSRWRLATIKAGLMNANLAIVPAAHGWHVRGHAALKSLDAGTDDGRRAVQGLTARLAVNLTLSAEKTAGQVKLTLPRGQLYWDPIFVDAGKFPLRVSATAAWSPQQGGAVHISKLSFSQPGALQAHADNVVVNPVGKPWLVALNARVDSLSLPGGYSIYLQPLLTGTPLDDLTTAGDISGKVRLRRGRVQSLHVTPDRIYLRDRHHRFSVQRLAGHVVWHKQAKAQAISTLSWKQAHWLRIPLGAAKAQVVTGGRRVELDKPVTIPVGSGELHVDHFVSDDIGTDGEMFFLAAHATPIKLGPLTRALGWPAFTGAVSGQMPPLRYADHTLKAAGDLVASVFGGKVRVKGLKIERPLGRRPVLTADVQMHNLDLQTLTSTFSFGSISGTLDGHIQGLRLVDWRPAAFDARFFSAPKRREPRRISQRAVANLSSLGGGGAGAALSHGLMSYFSHFSYSRLGLGCRLQARVCQMSGIKDTPNGYLIVEGAGLPRISVIGHNKRVDWKVLVKQLVAATNGQGPVVR